VRELLLWVFRRGFGARHEALVEEKTEVGVCSEGRVSVLYNYLLAFTIQVQWPCV
jgi:hypothetical protein